LGRAPPTHIVREDAEQEQDRAAEVGLDRTSPKKTSPSASIGNHSALERTPAARGARTVGDHSTTTMRREFGGLEAERPSLSQRWEPLTTNRPGSNTAINIAATRSPARDEAAQTGRSDARARISTAMPPTRQACESS